MNSMEQIFLIRDARGLDSWDKAFLFTVASRGEAGMFCEWARNADDMGMKKDRYYKSRASLLDKGLITAQERKDASTVYKIVDSALTEWVASHSVTQNSDSVTQNEHSATQNGRSVSPERKKNTKKNIKKNLEEELNESAGASSFPIDSNLSNKDIALEEVGAPRLPNPPYSEESSPIPLNEQDAPVSPMVAKNTRHSATQNEEAPVEPRFVPCPSCSVPMDRDRLCWAGGCTA